MAYGFLLVVYGPVHHVVTIPLALRLRRAGGRRSTVGRHLPNAGLALFLAAVVVLGTFPAGPMVFDFQSSLEGAGADVDPDLLCTKSTTGEVVSGGERIAVDDSPPFEFEVHSEEMTAVTGERQFQVVLRDADGNTLRRYTRTLSIIEES